MSTGAGEYTDCISATSVLYGTKQFDGEATVLLEIWGMRSTHLLPSLPGPLWFGVVAYHRVLFLGQIELFNI